MKTISAVLSLWITTGLPAGLVVAFTPADAQQREHRDFAVAERFEAIALDGADSVRVIQGERYSITAIGDRGALDALRIEARDGTLSIGRRPGTYRDRGALVTVTLPTLTAVTIAGSGDLHADMIRGKTFIGEVRGSGTLRVDALRTQRADLRVRGSGDVVATAIQARNLAIAAGGSGDIRAAGRAAAVALSLAGSGDVDVRALDTASLSVAAAGSGNIHARSSGVATGSVTGSGSVVVGGGARCTIARGGTAVVRCG